MKFKSTLYHKTQLTCLRKVQGTTPWSIIEVQQINPVIGELTSGFQELEHVQE